MAGECATRPELVCLVPFTLRRCAFLFPLAKGEPPPTSSFVPTFSLSTTPQQVSIPQRALGVPNGDRNHGKRQSHPQLDFHFADMVKLPLKIFLARSLFPQQQNQHVRRSPFRKLLQLWPACVERCVFWVAVCFG